MIGSPRSSVMIPVTFRSCVTGTEALPALSETDGYRVILSLKIKIGLPGDLVQYAVDGSVLEL